jgi:hypothetical protein
VVAPAGVDLTLQATHEVPGQVGPGRRQPAAHLVLGELGPALGPQPAHLSHPQRLLDLFELAPQRLGPGLGRLAATGLSTQVCLRIPRLAAGVVKLGLEPLVPRLEEHVDPRQRATLDDHQTGPPADPGPPFGDG